MKALLRRIRQILKDRRVRKFFTRFVATVASIVVFVTTYALILPAITLESTPVCGVEAHQHTDECYEDVLVCEIPESDGHKHTDDCYSIESVLTCEETEHTHSVENGCYEEDGNLICEIPEHVHDADNGCYKEVRTLTCEIQESEGHHHTADCYEKVLTCGKEVHTHSVACYEDDTMTEAAVAASTSSTGATTGATGASTSSAASTGASSVASTDAASTGASTVEEPSNTGSTIEYGFENAGTGSTDASTALTTVENAAAGVTADGQYIPQLEPVDFVTVLDNNTGIYYYPVAEDEVIEDSSVIPAESWVRIGKNTELGKGDLLRVYLAYTVPAGSLNTTNQVSRYRLPANLHLTDAQVKAINENVNGIAGQYVNYDSLEILDTDKYYAYLGVEAVEGDRRPDEDVDGYLRDLVKAGKDGSEYISATVRVENVYDEKDGEYLGQDLVFTWTPYTIEKNEHQYDASGKPTKAGEKIEGWITLDFNTSQIDWDEASVDTFERGVEVDARAGAETVAETVAESAVDDQTVDSGETEAAETSTAIETVEHTEQTAEVVFVNEGRDDKGNKIHEISTTLTMVEETVVDAVLDDADAEQENAGEAGTAEAGEAATDDAAAATTEDATAGSTEDATAAATEDAATATTEDSTTASTEDKQAEQDKQAEVAEEEPVEYRDGTLTADGDSYKITLDYTAEAQIPDNAYLSVREITAETYKEAYEACLEQARAQVESTDDMTVQKVDTAATRFFDIEILAEETVKSDKADKADKDDETSDAASNEGTTVDGSNAAVEETVTDVDDTATVDIDNTDEAETASDDVTEATVENTEYGQNASDAAVEDTNEASGAEKADEEAAATTTIRKIEPAAPVSVRIELMDAAVERTDAEEAASSEQKNDLQKNDLQKNDPTVLHFSEDGVETLDSTTGGATVSNDFVNDQNVDDQKDGAGDAGSGATAAAGTTEIIGTTGTTETTGTAVQFEASSFSIYGLVYTTITTTILTASGETYEITVDYDEDAQIPEGSELRVREITADDEEYEALYQEASQRATEDAASQGINVPVVTGARLFDIEIHAEVDNGEGGAEDVKIEPAAPVRVSIKLINAWKNEDDATVASEDTEIIEDTEGSKNSMDSKYMSVVHFAEDGTETMSLKESGEEDQKGEKSSNQTITLVKFEAQSFSVYTVLNVSSLDDYLNNAKYALVSQNGPGIYTPDNTSNTDILKYAMTSSTTDFTSFNGDTTTLAGKVVYMNTSDSTVGGDVTEWGFEAGENSKYYIYTTDSSGAKQYIYVDYNSLKLTNDKDNASQFGVQTSQGKIRFSVDVPNNGTWYITNAGGNPSLFDITQSTGNDSLFTLAELDPNYEENAATKVSAADWKDSSAGTGKWNENSTVIIYRRIEHADGSEELYVLATDGTLLPAYDGGDSIFYHCPVDKNVNWHVALGASGYYISSVVPDGSSDPTVYLAPSVTNGTWSSNSAVGLVLGGIGNSYGTTIENWDQAAYAYAGLHVDATNSSTLSQGIVPGSGDTSDTFLFAVTGTLISEGELHTVDTVDSTSKGITMKIFNYSGPVYNYGYRNAAMQAVMGDDMLSDWNNRKSRVTQTVSTKLGDRGFPVSLSNGESYEPLFTVGETINYPANSNGYPQAYDAGSITVTGGDANHLFIQSYYDESQTFRYSSMENFAHYNTVKDEENNVEAGSFTVYRETGTPNIPTQSDHYYYYHGHFMPYNTLDSDVSVSRIVDQYGSLEDKEQARSYENVYGLSETPDYYVGMTLEAKFVQPSDGKLENGDPVVYKFTGDDDLLVYIDGILVLDVGGIHEPLTGSINFETGTIIQPDFYNDSNGSAWGHHETTLYQVFNNAYNSGFISDEDWLKMKWKDADGDGIYDTFADYSTHSFNMFYMERGAGASNLDLQFNLQVVKKDEFTVRKKLQDGVKPEFVNQLYRFKAVFKDNGETKALYPPIKNEQGAVTREGAKDHDGNVVCTKVIYADRKDSDGKPIEVPVSVDDEGYFTLRADEAAVFTMSNEETVYDIYEVDIDGNIIRQVDINGTSTQIDPETGPAQVHVGEDTVEDRSEVNVTNTIAKQDLLVTKHITEDSEDGWEDDNPVFEFRVYLEQYVTDDDGNIVYETVTDTTTGVTTQKPKTKLVPYSRSPYYLVKIPTGQENNKDAWEYYTLTGENNAPILQPPGTVCSITGRSGTINSIPPEYTIIIPNLAVGTHFYVEERRVTIPEGYEWDHEQLNHETCDPSSFGENAQIDQILTIDNYSNNEEMYFDRDSVGRIKDGDDAEFDVWNRKPAVEIPVEKSWEDNNSSDRPENVTLALVRYMPQLKYTPEEGKGAIIINHTADYGENYASTALPSGFVATYTIEKLNTETNEYEVVISGTSGPFDVDAGEYRVITVVNNRGNEPTNYTYNKTETVTVTVVQNQSTVTNVISEYQYEQGGTITIAHNAVYQGGTLEGNTTLPENISVTYTIKDKNTGRIVYRNVAADTYDVPVGTYTVTANVSNNDAPANYSYQGTTVAGDEGDEDEGVVVTSGGSATATLTSTYKYVEPKTYGTITIDSHVSSGLTESSPNLPNGIGIGAYRIVGPTTIVNAQVGQTYEVESGDYTVSVFISYPAAPDGYSYIGTPEQSVTVTAGDDKHVTLTSAYGSPGSIQINHTASGLNGTTSLPGDFNVQYSIIKSDGTTVKDHVAAGTYNVPAGQYTVIPYVYGTGTTPVGYAYLSTTESTEVTVTSGDTVTANIVSTYGANGTITIRHTSEGFGNSSTFPQDFQAGYIIKDADGNQVNFENNNNITVDTPYSVAPGTYTVSYTIYYAGNLNGYEYLEEESTDSVEVTVVSEQNTDANLVSKYQRIGGNNTEVYLCVDYSANEANMVLQQTVPINSEVTLRYTGNYQYDLYYYNGYSWASDYSRPSLPEERFKDITLGDATKYCVVIYADHSNANTINPSIMPKQPSGMINPEGSYPQLASNEVVPLQLEEVDIDLRRAVTAGNASLALYSHAYNHFVASEEGETESGSGAGGGSGSGSGSGSGTTPTDVNPSSLTIPGSITSSIQILNQTIMNSLAEGEEGYEYVLDPSFGKSIVLSDGNDWSYVFQNLEELGEGGRPYYYAIIETSVPENYSVSYSNNPISASEIRTNMEARAEALKEAQEQGIENPELPTLTTLSAINAKNTANLDLTKRIAGTGADPDKEFDFTITLTAPSGKQLAESYTFMKGAAAATGITYARSNDGTTATITGIKLKGDEVFTIVDLPAGTIYEVSESDYSEDGYSASTTSGSLTGAVSAGSTASNSVEVTNTHSTGTLTVEKSISGNGALATDEFQFKVTVVRQNNANGMHGQYVINGVSRDVSFTNGTAEVTFTLKGGERAEFIGLQKGASFTVEELSADQNGYETTVTSTGGTVSGKTVTGTIHATTAITAAYTNSRESVTLDILKIEKNNAGKKLGGATFVIQKVNETISGNEPSNDTTWVYNASDKQKVTSEEGETSFANLGMGYYRIEETIPPAGYVNTGTSEFYIHVDQAGVHLVKPVYDEDKHEWSWVAGTENNNVTLPETITFTAEVTATIENEPGAELPNSGGPGTRLIYLLGGMLTLAAGLLLLHDRKRIGT